MTFYSPAAELVAVGVQVSVIISQCIYEEFCVIRAARLPVQPLLYELYLCIIFVFPSSFSRTIQLRKF